MNKSVWIFLLAVFLPGAVLGWLALRGVEEQQIVFERRTAELYQKETDALAASVRDAVEAQRRDFSEVVRQLLAQGDPYSLAQDFNNTLADAWPHKAIGFAINTDGTILSPTVKAASDDAELRDFLRSNGDWIGNSEVASVYRVPIDSNNARLAAFGGSRGGGGNKLTLAEQQKFDEQDANFLLRRGRSMNTANAEPVTEVPKVDEPLSAGGSVAGDYDYDKAKALQEQLAQRDESAASQRQISAALTDDETEAGKYRKEASRAPSAKPSAPAEDAPGELRFSTKGGFSSPAPAEPATAKSIRSTDDSEAPPAGKLVPSVPSPSPAPVLGAAPPAAPKPVVTASVSRPSARQSTTPLNGESPDATGSVDRGSGLPAGTWRKNTDEAQQSGRDSSFGAAPADSSGQKDAQLPKPSEPIELAKRASARPPGDPDGKKQELAFSPDQPGGPQRSIAPLSPAAPPPPASSEWDGERRSGTRQNLADLADQKLPGNEQAESKSLRAQPEQYEQFEAQPKQQWAASNSSGFINNPVRNVEPIQILNAPSQAVSSLTPATADFHMLTSVSYEGMVSRFVQDKLDLILWMRTPEAPELVFGCLIEASNLQELWPALVGTVSGDDSGGQPPFVLALLNDKAKPMAVQTSVSKDRDWKRPFVATEIGEVLPHWEAALYLASPHALAESARGFRRTLSFTVAAALALILIGAWLVVADIRRQLALAQQKTDFVSNVSHELKTPLTSIRMFAELMHDRPPPAEKQGQYLRIITVEAERLTRLINNVLDFAKLERRQKRFEKKPLDLHGVIARVWEGHEMHLRDAGFATRWEAAPGPYPVVGDEDALSQILVNLLSNAEKYSLERKDVELHSWSEDQWLFLSVVDRGMGVPDGEERKIFESFYRAHDSLSCGIQGSGLGLTLAQRVAEEHGGKIEFARREGGGCRFTLRLPLASGDHPADSGLRGQSPDFPSASPLPPV